MAHCPRCQHELESSWEQKCPSCGTALIYCYDCASCSELHWICSDDTPEVYANCGICKKRIDNSAHVLKSSIYNFYRYAFKFVNAIHVPYPMYFESNAFPFGKITDDLGDFVNDFHLAEVTGHDRDNEDWGTARAHRVNIEDDDDILAHGIALSHETGLEVFLIAASAFVGMEVAKFTLKRTLEATERRINEWWKRRKGQH